MKKTKLQTPTVADEEIPQSLLPYDIIVEDILTRLPVKSIFRFRCVCKHWCNKLFKDPKFINSHLKKSIETGKFNCFALKGLHKFQTLTSRSSSSLTSFEDDYVKITNVFEFPLKSLYIKSSDMWFYTYGSCNGLILLRSRMESKDTNLCLWNPTTKEFKIIQLPYDPFRWDPYNLYHYSYDHQRQPVETYGLGYDCDTDDYKIVKAIAEDGEEHDMASATRRKVCHGTKVQVYSLKSDSWKPLPDNVPYDIDSCSYAFVNGALHWIAAPCPISTAPTSMLIVSYDIRGENFSVVPLSPQVDELFTGPQHPRRTLSVLRGCLCVVAAGPSNIEVWVMEDPKVRDSWTQLFTAQLPVVKEKVLCGMTFQWELKNGKLLFKARLDHSSDTYFVVYDSAVHHKQAEVSEIYCISGTRYSVETYVETLVSISGTYAGEPSLQEEAVSNYLERQKQAISKYLKHQ